MADSFRLTEIPVRVTSTCKQPYRQALDVSEYDEATLLLSLFEYVGAGTITVRILTSMQKEIEDGWVVLDTFTAANTPGTFEKKASKDLLRFLRWEVSVFGGTAATFGICGMLRRWS